jgi:DnaJ family protein C protein 28
MTLKREQLSRRRRLEQAQQKVEEHRLPPGEANKEGQADDGSREAARRLLVERKIQEAIDNGVFDNLPGRGKPLSLHKNPYMEPGQELAFGLLKHNGFAPEWIERDQAIRRELAEARAALARARDRFRADPAGKTAWQKAVARFEQRLARLNRQIDDFNLIVPVVTSQRPRLRLEAELRRLEQDPGAADS